ncbi:hypothetical protein ONA70_26860 [Micromonospora yasonensis]|nr:hypothetical protein [Micromonospora yasonensis]
MSMSLALSARGPGILDPEWLISTFGLVGILAIVFAESGLLIGFLFPGDSLLFTAGLLVADGHYLHQPLWLVCLLVVVAAVTGDQVGYLFGKRVGPSLFRRPDSRLFKQQYVVEHRVHPRRHRADLGAADRRPTAPVPPVAAPDRTGRAAAPGAGGRPAS